MSDVTGNLGNESIRLRGMALEETQYQILKTLEKMANMESKDPVTKGLDKLDVAGASAATSLSKSTGTLSKVGAAFTTIGEKLSKSGGEFIETFTRISRGYDSNVRDSSYAIRNMAINTKGASAAIYKFAADSVGQLEEQFEVYKRLSNVGGTVAGDFENLRINAASMGVTMQEYTGLLENNFQNLRMGGTSAYRAMQGLKAETIAMRDGSAEINEQFMRLGVGASDYGQMILQNTMLLGGFGKVQTEAGGKFAQKMLDTTKTVTALSDAFGFNREQVMKASNDALKDSRNRTVYNNIENKGKAQLLNFFTGMFDGDAQKGMNATVAAFTGRFDENTAMMESMAPGLLDKVKILSESLATNPDDFAGAVAKSNLGSVMATLQGNMLGLSNATLNTSDTAGTMVNALGNLADKTGASNEDIVRNMMERGKKENNQNTKTLDALGAVQRQNIRMAEEFATTNKMLNEFGVTTALVSQIMINVMGKMAKGTMILGKDALDGFNIQDIVKDSSKIVNAEIEKLSKEAGKKYDEALKTVAPELAERRANEAVQPTAPVANGNIPIQVSGVNATPNTIDQAKTQATRGGATSSGIKSLLGAIASSRKLNVTGVNDLSDAHVPGSTHKKGLGVDFKVAGGAPEADKTVNEIKSYMKAAGLTEGKDYELLNEYRVQSPGWTGEHLHVGFKSQEAADKFAAIAEQNQKSAVNNPKSTPPAANASNTSSPKTAVTTSTNQQNQANSSSNSPTAVISNSNGNMTSEQRTVGQENTDWSAVIVQKLEIEGKATRDILSTVADNLQRNLGSR